MSTHTCRSIARAATTLTVVSAGLVAASTAGADVLNFDHLDRLDLFTRHDATALSGDQAVAGGDFWIMDMDRVAASTRSLYSSAGASLPNTLVLSQVVGPLSCEFTFVDAATGRAMTTSAISALFIDTEVGTML